MNVSQRIHIAPLGFEHDRIVLPAKEYDADHVILLDFIADNISRPAYHEDVIDDLETAGITVTQLDCDLFNLYESMSVIANQAIKHNGDGDNVYVNLTTGSTITAIGGMIACMVTGAAIPYYVRADEYASGTEPIGHGMEFADELPRYPMDGPDEQQVAVLAYLAFCKQESENVPETYDIRKDDLIEFGKESNLPFATEYTGDSKKGYYRRLDRHVLDPLLDRDYITIKTVGRSKRIHPTEVGINTAKAFSYLLQKTDAGIQPNDLDT